MAFSKSTSITDGGGARPKSPHHQQSQSQSQFQDQSASSPLNKQSSSIFSLTLDEIQLKSGMKSFGSMNMDEFLTNLLWNNNVDEEEEEEEEEDQVTTNQQPIIETKPALTRQNSFSIPTQLCKKTVEQVWSEIQKDNHIANLEPPQRQPTFGEITLEEFLIKAGVFQEPPAPPPQKMAPAAAAAPPPMPSSNDACLDATYGMMGLTCPMMALGFSNNQPISMGMGNGLLVNGYGGAYPIYAPTTRIVGELENEKSQQGMFEAIISPKGSRKRLMDDLHQHEVVVERRQRRMIKNRESAARSRARKQAYTVELELELAQLKEENEKLKETVMELEQKKYIK